MDFEVLSSMSQARSLFDMSSMPSCAELSHATSVLVGMGVVPKESMVHDLIKAKAATNVVLDTLKAACDDGREHMSRASFDALRDIAVYTGDITILRSSMQVILTCIEQDSTKAGFIWMLDDVKKAMTMLMKALAFEGASRRAACKLIAYSCESHEQAASIYRLWDMLPHVAHAIDTTGDAYVALEALAKTDDANHVALTNLGVMRVTVERLQLNVAPVTEHMTRFLHNVLTNYSEAIVENARILDEALANMPDGELKREILYEKQCILG